MEYNSNYFKNNRDRFSQYAARQRDKLKQETIEAYGGKCNYCDECDPDALCMDHINDDSHVEKTEFGNNRRGSHRLFAKLKRQGWPRDRFQLLCYNCNAKKENKRRRAAMIERRGEDYVADQSKAHANVPPPRHNTSGIKGVFWNSQKQKWNARVMVNYQNKHLGFFDSIRDAANAYAKGAREIWGDAALVATEEEIAAAEKMHNGPAVSTVRIEDLGL